MMHPAVTRLGFHAANAAYADSFLRACEHLGAPTAEGIRILEWFASTYGPNSRVGIEDVGPAFEYAAGRNGWSEDVAQAAAGWFTAVQSAGGNPEAVKPIGDEQRSGDAERIAAIEKLKAENRGAYDRDRRLQDEHIDLIARNSDQPSRQKRLENIREYRRREPDAFERDTALQREELALLEHQTSEGTTE